MNKKARVIAFYLPQFHPIPENDEWWGKGFTEWTCMGKARPLYKGHYQPRVPADLGYYDLRVPEVRQMQVNYAKRAGIEGFCYWHYWFGNGKRLLERPFDEVLTSGKPDFPFMLGWANHSWYAKLWDKDTKKDKLLIEQVYPSIDDYKVHFKYVLKAFRDSRYIHDGERPMFLVFRPFDLPKDFISTWQQLAYEAGLKSGIAFIGSCRFNESCDELLKMGYDYVYADRIGMIYQGRYTMWMKIRKHLSAIIQRKPLLCFDYADAVKQLSDPQQDARLEIIPSLMPNWDHSPRSGGKGLILDNSTPDRFSYHAEQMLNNISNKPADKRFLFLKSWNEWGEGNYMEPDLHYGCGYIDALAKLLKE